MAVTAGLPFSDILDAVIARAAADPNVQALVLFGSAARGMLTEHSDLDVFVIVAAPSTEWTSTRSRQVDLPVLTLDELADIPADPNDWWLRYSFAHAAVLYDCTDGRIEALLQAQEHLSADGARRAIGLFLDGYINFAYRSLKSHRDGRTFEAVLDAAESLPWAFNTIFALDDRVRPYNKYLRWELDHHPLDAQLCDPTHLLELIERIRADTDPAAQRELFSLIDAGARRRGYAGIVDGWEAELELLAT
ncbi:MAG: hypothetical protein DLM58_12385 [Pseudonocardiales bacterium]|nr:MAG: hypothetical protein DLM58_12385 [Pseudonocardiales bacterium]